MQLLIAAGANTDTQSSICKETPLYIAAYNGHIAVAKLLLDAEANKNAQTSKKRTPLHIAAEKGHTEIAQILIAAGAKIEAQDENGKTPLQLAQLKPYVNSPWHNVSNVTYDKIIKLLQDAAKSKAKPQTTAPFRTSTEDSSTVNTQIPPKTIESSKLPVAIETPSKTKAVKPPTPSNTDFIINYSNIVLGEKIGSGGFGDVFKAKWLGQDVAVKKLHMKNMSDESEQEFKQESSIWQKLSHPNIVQLFGICIPSSLHSTVTSPPDPYCMIMRYKPSGSLYNLLKNKSLLTWPARKQLAIDIGSALLYLHNKNILHRDLKSLNVLVSEQDRKLRASLTDFGLSIVKRETSSTTTKISKQQSSGTLLWMAPELLRGRRNSTQSDVYAYGMILWELATRKLPFYEADPKAIFQLIKNGDTPEIPSGTPSNFASVIKKCWDLNQNKRPAIKTILELLQGQKPTEAKPSSELLQTGLLSSGSHSSLIRSTGSSNPTGRKVKKKISELKKLLDQAYPEDDELDEEDTEYRSGVLTFFASLKGSQKLDFKQKSECSTIKQFLLDQLDSSGSDSDPDMPMSTTVLKS